MTTCIEICVEDSEGVRIATDNGADRVELCIDLAVGGLTPPIALIEEAIPYAPVQGLQILVRPTAGSFILSDADVDEVTSQIHALMNVTHNAPVPVGFVVGAVTEQRTINVDAALVWRGVSAGRPLTFHRAFDCIKDLHHGVDTLMSLGYDRVLTTGGSPSIAQAAVLKNLVEWASRDGSVSGTDSERSHQFTILASGGLRADNVAEVVRQSGVCEVHMRAPVGQSDRCQGDHASSTDSIMVADIVRAVKN